MRRCGCWQNVRTPHQSARQLFFENGAAPRRAEQFGGEGVSAEDTPVTLIEIHGELRGSVKITASIDDPNVIERMLTRLNSHAARGPLGVNHSELAPSSWESPAKDRERFEVVAVHHLACLRASIMNVGVVNADPSPTTTDGHVDRIV